MQLETHEDLIFDAAQMTLEIVKEFKEAQCELLRKQLKSISQEIWKIKFSDYSSTSVPVDPMIFDYINCMQKNSEINSIGIDHLYDEKYSQDVDKDKLVVFDRYQESGVDVQSTYHRYIQSENLKSLKDLPSSLKHILSSNESTKENLKLIANVVLKESPKPARNSKF